MYSQGRGRGPAFCLGEGSRSAGQVRPGEEKGGHGLGTRWAQPRKKDLQNEPNHFIRTAQKSPPVGQ